MASAPPVCALPIHASIPRGKAIILFRLLADGFWAADLRRYLAALAGRSPILSDPAPSPINCAAFVTMA
jgi:hypothetical protein